MKLLIITAIIVFCSSYVFADDRIDLLTKRIEELEKQQEELLFQTTESRGEVRSFLNDKIHFGGFFEPSFTAMAGPDTELQAGNHNNFLGINIAADFDSNFHFVSQFITALGSPLTNPHNDPRAAALGQPESREFGNYTVITILTQGYIEYSFGGHYRIQGGVGYVPFGYALQQRELVLFVRRGGPQILRTADLLTPLWSGLNFMGDFRTGSHSWGYSLHTVTSIDNSHKPGLGGRLWTSSANEKVTMGVSTQTGKKGTHGYEVLGSDLRLHFAPFTIQMEYVQNFIDGEDPWSAYVEPNVAIYDESVLLYVFGDYANGARNQTGAGNFKLSDPFKKWEYGFGVNWLPTSYTRFRAGLIFNDYIGNTATVDGQNRDYTALDLSAGIAF